jgi:uncharacterized protein YbjT (DUF2867 family)
MKDLGAVLIALDGRDPEERTVEERTTRTLVEAAAASGVAIIYTSRLHADRLTGVPGLDLKGRLELAARRSGAQVTILRPGMLMDVFDDRACVTVCRGRGAAERHRSSTLGVVPGCRRPGHHAPCLLEVPGLRGATFELGGPQAVTLRELIRSSGG